MARKKTIPAAEPEKTLEEQVPAAPVPGTEGQAAAVEQPELSMDAEPERNTLPDAAAEAAEETAETGELPGEDGSQPALDDPGQEPPSGAEPRSDPLKNNPRPSEGESVRAEVPEGTGRDNGRDTVVFDSELSRMPEEWPALPPEYKVLSVDLSAPVEALSLAPEAAAYVLEDEPLSDADSDAAQKEAEEPVFLPEELARDEKPSEKSDRQKFFELKFNRLDRDLTPEERQEWNSIYASYRGRSSLTGTIIGIDPYHVDVWNRESGQMERQTMYCAIVIPYRVRIVIPSTEM